MSLPLYQIADQYRAILSLADRDDEDPATLRQSVQDTLDALDIDRQFADKALSVACFTRELEAEALAVKQTEESLRPRRKSLESRAEWMRDYLAVQMQKAGRPELKDSRILVRLRKTPPRVVVDRESEIPAEFVETETVTHIRKKWMLDKLKSGEVGSIPGIHIETGVAVSLR